MDSLDASMPVMEQMTVIRQEAIQVFSKEIAAFRWWAISII